MTNSKTIKYILSAATSFVALAASVQAQTTVQVRSVNNGITEGFTKASLTYSFSFDGTNLAASNDAYIFNDPLTFDTGLAGGDTFSWVATSATDWNTATAQTQIGADTFGTYLSGLTAGDISVDSNRRTGVTGGDNDTQLGDGEALIYDFDVSGLNGSSVLSLNNIVRNNTTDSAYDYVIYDTGDNSVVASVFNSTSGVDFGANTVIQSDWILVLTGTGGLGTTGDWRLNHLIVDFTPSAIPEPGTFALLAGFAAFGSIMLRRRR